jgi:rRNA processing protein Gar1
MSAAVEDSAKWEELVVAVASVAPARADVFAENGNKIGKIVRKFGEVDLAESQGVVCQT